MTTTITREQAVKAIAGHLADRDAYVITVPPELMPEVTRSLDGITDWTAYLDGGLPVVIRTDRAAVLTITGALTVSAAVLTVLKRTTAAAALSAALGQEIRDDGSQDIVVLHDNGPMVWPLLFVDALAVVDPGAAAAIHANQVHNLN
jgi:hypothetical protein